MKDCFLDVTSGFVLELPSIIFFLKDTVWIYPIISSRDHQEIRNSLGSLFKNSFRKISNQLKILSVFPAWFWNFFKHISEISSEIAYFFDKLWKIYGANITRFWAIRTLNSVSLVRRFKPQSKWRLREIEIRTELEVVKNKFHRKFWKINQKFPKYFFSEYIFRICF